MDEGFFAGLLLHHLHAFDQGAPSHDGKQHEKPGRSEWDNVE
jgi:hypothetical protein